MATLKQQIVKYLQDKDWVPKGELLKVRWTYSYSIKEYMAETVGRKLRELESESVIAVRGKGKSVEYKFLPATHTSHYIPWSMRTDKSKLFR